MPEIVYTDHFVGLFGKRIRKQVSEFIDLAGQKALPDVKKEEQDSDDDVDMLWKPALALEDRSGLLMLGDRDQAKWIPERDAADIGEEIRWLKNPDTRIYYKGKKRLSTLDLDVDGTIAPHTMALEDASTSAREEEIETEQEKKRRLRRERKYAAMNVDDWLYA